MVPLAMARQSAPTPSEKAAAREIFIHSPNPSDQHAWVLFNGPTGSQLRVKPWCETQNQVKRINEIGYCWLLRDQGVGGSNPLSPTNNLRAFLSGSCADTHPSLLNSTLDQMRGVTAEADSFAKDPTAPAANAIHRESSTYPEYSYGVEFPLRPRWRWSRP
jgi:hypothetical protein